MAIEDERLLAIENACVMTRGLSIVALIFCVCLMIHVRYFCHVEENEIGDLSFQGMKEMHEHGYNVRIISFGHAILDDEERWEHYRQCFLVEVPANYVNVVCGFKSEADRCWTMNVRNIALMLPDSTPPDRYDAWFTNPRAMAAYLKVF